MIWLILLLIIVFIIVVIAFSIVSFRERAKAEVLDFIKIAKEIPSEIISESDLKDLPEPLQKYLRYCGIIGKEKIRFVRLKQSGWFRTKVNQSWFPLKAVQYFLTDPPAFSWYATIKSARLFPIVARDIYSAGKGNMLVKFLSAIRIIDAKGKELDQGALVRYLAEIIWFPTAFLNKNIQWEVINSNSVKATLVDRGVTASGILYFNEENHLTHFISEERYMAVGKKFQKEKWLGICKNYKEFNGITIPSEGEVIWNLESGDFPYVRWKITEIEYNNFSIY